MTASATTRILLVDDDAAMRDTVTTLLADYEVETAPTCEDALGRLAERAGAIFVVLLDIGFGDGRLQGDAALPLIRERWPELEVIMLTIEEDVALAVRCMQLGAFDYVVKGPGMIATLPQRIAQVATLVALRRRAVAAEAEAERQRQLARAACRSLAPDLSAAPDPRVPSPRSPAAIARLEDVERGYCLEVLRLCDGDRARAARTLGVPPERFRQMLKRWGVAPPN